jgi:hypothetical protein
MDKENTTKNLGGTTNTDEDKDGDKTSTSVLNFRTRDGI